MASIIIPAHNESAVIGNTLSGLLSQVDECDELIVVCNGCSDATADVARRFAPRVAVIELGAPSKTAALNEGDRCAKTFPRVYVDADVSLGKGAFKRIISDLNGGTYLAAAPSPIMDLQYSTWAVKAYYDIWLSLPYCRKGMIGAGVYALSEAGHLRLGEFPSLIADDGYVRALFREGERGVVSGAHSLVRAPINLSWLLRIKTRSRLGYMELSAKYPDLIRNEKKDYGIAIFSILARPSAWLGVIIYLYVNTLSRIFAKQKFKDIVNYRWEKDDSSRQAERW